MKTFGKKHLLWSFPNGKVLILTEALNIYEMYDLYVMVLQPFRLKQVRVAMVCYKTFDCLVFCVPNVVTSFTTNRRVRLGSWWGGTIMKTGCLPCAGRVTILNPDWAHPVFVSLYKIFCLKTEPLPIQFKNNQTSFRLLML